MDDYLHLQEEDAQTAEEEREEEEEEEEREFEEEYRLADLDADVDEEAEETSSSTSSLGRWLRGGVVVLFLLSYGCFLHGALASIVEIKAGAVSFPGADVFEQKMTMPDTLQNLWDAQNYLPLSLIAIFSLFVPFLKLSLFCLSVYLESVSIHPNTHLKASANGGRKDREETQEGGDREVEGGGDCIRRRRKDEEEGREEEEGMEVQGEKEEEKKRKKEDDKTCEERLDGSSSSCSYSTASEKDMCQRRRPRCTYTSLDEERRRYHTNQLKEANHKTSGMSSPSSFGLSSSSSSSCVPLQDFPRRRREEDPLSASSSSFSPLSISFVGDKERKGEAMKGRRRRRTYDRNMLWVRLMKILRFISKYQLVDVYVVILMVSFIHFSVVHANPLSAAISFLSYCLLSIFATQCLYFVFAKSSPRRSERKKEKTSTTFSSSSLPRAPSCTPVISVSDDVVSPFPYIYYYPHPKQSSSSSSSTSPSSSSSSSSSSCSSSFRPLVVSSSSTSDPSPCFSGCSFERRGRRRRRSLQDEKEDLGGGREDFDMSVAERLGVVTSVDLLEYFIRFSFILFMAFLSIYGGLIAWHLPLLSVSVAVGENKEIQIDRRDLSLSQLAVEALRLGHPLTGFFVLTVFPLLLSFLHLLATSFIMTGLLILRLQRYFFFSSLSSSSSFSSSSSSFLSFFSSFRRGRRRLCSCRRGFYEGSGTAQRTREKMSSFFSRFLSFLLHFFLQITNLLTDWAMADVFAIGLFTAFFTFNAIDILKASIPLYHVPSTSTLPPPTSSSLLLNKRSSRHLFPSPFLSSSLSPSSFSSSLFSSSFFPPYHEEDQIPTLSSPEVMKELHTSSSHYSTTSVHPLFFPSSSPFSFSSSPPPPSSSSITLSSLIFFLSELLNFPSLPRSGFWAAMLMGACAFQLQRLLPSKDSMQTEIFFTRISKETKILIFFLLRQKNKKQDGRNGRKDEEEEEKKREEQEEDRIMVTGRDSLEMRRWMQRPSDMTDNERKDANGPVASSSEIGRLPLVDQALSGCRRRRRKEEEREDEGRLGKGRDLTDEERRREESQIEMRRRRKRRKSLQSFFPSSSSFSSISWFLSTFRFSRDDEEEDAFLTRHTKKKESLASPLLLSVHVDKEEEEERKCLPMRDRRTPPRDRWNDPIKDQQEEQNAFILPHEASSSSSSSSSSSYSPPTLSENLSKRSVEEAKEEKKEREEEEDKVDDFLQLSRSPNNLATCIDTRHASKSHIPLRRSLLSASPLLSSSSLGSARVMSSQECRFPFSKTKEPRKNDEKEKEETKEKEGDNAEEEFEEMLKKKKKRKRQVSVWANLMLQILVRLSVVSMLLYFLFTWPEGTPKTLDLQTLNERIQHYYPTISRALHPLIPATIGDCTSTEPEPPPKPCKGNDILYHYRNFYYEATARWITGVNTTEIDSIHLERQILSYQEDEDGGGRSEGGRNQRVKVIAEVNGTVAELNLSLRIGQCLFPNSWWSPACDTLWDNTTSCCGRNITFSSQIQAVCTDQLPAGGSLYRRKKKQQEVRESNTEKAGTAEDEEDERDHEEKEEEEELKKTEKKKKKRRGMIPNYLSNLNVTDFRISPLTINESVVGLFNVTVADITSSVEARLKEHMQTFLLPETRLIPWNEEDEGEEELLSIQDLLNRLIAVNAPDGFRCISNSTESSYSSS